MNIEQFELSTITVLSKLYDNHPIKTTIYERDLRGLIGDHSVSWEVFTETIDFLIAEGFIRGKPAHQSNQHGKTTVDVWSELVLSLNGLAVLNAIPKCLQLPERPAEPSKPLGEQIADALKSGAKTAIGALCKEAINSLVKVSVTGSP